MTFNELLEAAGRADQAGDIEAAKALVAAAEGMRAPSQGQIGPEHPQFVDMAAPKSDPVGATFPKHVVEDNFGDTIADAMSGPFAATKSFATGITDPSQSPTAAMLPDEWEDSPYKRRLGVAGDIAGAALSGLGTAFAGVAGTVGETFGGSPTNEKKLTRDLMMMGEVAVPELSGVSATHRLAGRAAKAANAPTKAPTPVQETARAADELGITPSLGAGGKLRGATAATLEKVPFSGGKIADDATRFVDDVEKAFNQTTAKIGRVEGATGGGEALQAGLNKFVTDFKAKSTTLYDKVGESIPKETVIQAPETVRMIKKAIAPFAGKPELAKQLGMNKWAAMADDLEGGLSWDAASELRTNIGGSVGKLNGPMADLDQGRLKQVYGRLTDDLEAAAKAAGPDAEKAWKRASNFYRRGAERITADLDRTIKADSPERAFEAFSAMTKEGRATANAKRLFTVKASMPKKEWNSVAASIIDRLGKAKPGQQSADGDAFSAVTFLTEWNKMTPEAKSVLVPQNLRKEMNSLAKVAEGAKRANAERNHSNTGQIVTGAAAATGAIQAPVSTALLLGGSAIGSKMLTSGPILRALNKMARGDASVMKALAKGNSTFSEDARTILTISAAEASQGNQAANSNSPALRYAQ